MKKNNEDVQDVVLGNGWSALGVLSQSLQMGRKALWLTGTGSHYFPLLPVLSGNEAAEAGQKIFSIIQREGAILEGCWVREYRNKAFHIPRWVQDSEERENFWEAERGWLQVEQMRWEGRHWVEMESDLRQLLESSELIQKESHTVLQKITPTESAWRLELADGRQVSCQNVWIGDRLHALHEVEGIPRPIAFFRGRSPHGVLQVVFSHAKAQEFGWEEAIYAPLGREAGESVQRHVWGYFFDQGQRSVWTVVIAPEEAEDNHQVAKKLRKVKQALDKIFPGFLERIDSEQVRYEEGSLYTSGKPVREPVAMPGMPGVFLMTDGYGPSLALLQASKVSSLCQGGTSTQAHAQTKSVNLESLSAT